MSQLDLVKHFMLMIHIYIDWNFVGLSLSLSLSLFFITRLDTLGL
jgi:hypothetical protein